MIEEAAVNTDQFDLIVVGAGITGATVAYIAAHDYHQKVLVLEKGGRIGGAVCDKRDGGTGLLVQEYGLHYLYTSDPHVYKFLTKIAEWKPFFLRAKAELDGEIVTSPFNFSSIDLLYPPEDAARLKRVLTEKYEYQMYVPLMDMLRSEDEDIHGLAIKLMRNYAIPYAAKQRDVPEETLNGSVMDGQCFALSYQDQCRMDRYQMLPSNGFSDLIEKMLSDERITVRLNAETEDYFHISKKGELEFPPGKKPVQVVYTGGLDELFGYRYGVLPYYYTCFEHKTEPSGKVEVPYVTYAGKEYSSVADCAMMDADHHGDRTILTYEYPQGRKRTEGSIKYLPVLTRRAKRVYEKYEMLAEKVEGLYVCGRLARYRYMSMAEAIQDAFNTISSIKFAVIDLIPDNVKYKRPPEMLLAPMDNFARNEHIKSDLIIGDLFRELPEVTVVIPTYKRLDGLKRTLRSVYSQDVPQSMYDIVIVDNDPTADNETQKYLEENATENLYYYRNRENLGVYGNLSRCFLLARTKWVCMVHNDDVLFSNAIRWALNSRDELRDPKLGAIIPRQMRVYSERENKYRMKEKGTVKKDAISERKRDIPKQKRRWMFFLKLFEDTRRRYWRISEFDCYMVPFLYPAVSYGTLINREAIIDIGGFYEGYPIDDNLTMNRLASKYHVYLCGQSWGAYAFYSAYVYKPLISLHFVDSVTQNRLYWEKKYPLCRIMSGIVRKGYYTDEVEGDAAFGLYNRGYTAKAENYQYYEKYRVGWMRRKLALRVQKCWEFWILLRAKLFGKRISFDMVRRCNGEHYGDHF